MSNIADKISKLIAKADSTTHPEEASSFMAMVHKLLEENGMSLLEVGRLQSDDPVGKSRKQAQYFASESCLRDVVFHLAEFYGCEAIVHTMGNHRWATVFGRDSARITFELMWPYVKKCLRAEARRLHLAERKAWDAACAERGLVLSMPSKVSSVARQFRAVSDAFDYRLQCELSDRRRNERENKVDTKGVNALVPVDLIQQLMDEYNAAPARDRELKLTQAAVDAAGSISLNLQTTGAKQKQLR